MIEHLLAEEINKFLEMLGCELGRDTAETVLIIAKVSQGGVEFEGGCFDHWTNDSQCLIRVHRALRQALFIPHQVQHSPSLSSLIATRITHGTYEDGIFFVKRDNWNPKADRHLDMQRPWTGRSAFIPRPKIECA